MPHDTQPSSSLPTTTRNRLSLILHFPSPSLSISSISSISRRPGSSSSSTNKIRKRFRPHHAPPDIASVLSASSDTHHCPNTPPAASTISITDSLLSTPHESLLPSSHLSHPPSSYSLPSSPSQEHLPPTTNNLSLDDKMRLLKKVRKLSRVLGEFPIPVGESSPHTPSFPDASFSSPSSASSSPSSPSPPVSKPPTSKPSVSMAEKRASLRRSLTVGYDIGARLAQARDVHRVQSLQSLHPPLTIIPSTSTPSSSPITPITFAWPSDSPFTAQPLSAARPPSPNIGPLDTNPLTRQNSNASSVMSLSQSPEHVQRTRAAKLSRQLGDNVPPDILLRAASPTPRSQSPLPSVPPSPPAVQFQSSAPESSTPSQSVLDSSSLPRRSSSLRRRGLKRSAKSRLSLDIRALTGGISSGPPTAPLAPASPMSIAKSDKTPPLRRAKSLWIRKRLAETEVTSEPEDIHTATLFRKGSMEFSSMTGKQRMLNVRRAKKMTQASTLSHIPSSSPCSPPFSCLAISLRPHCSRSPTSPQQTLPLKSITKKNASSAVIPSQP